MITSLKIEKEGVSRTNKSYAHNITKASHPPQRASHVQKVYTQFHTLFTYQQIVCTPYKKGVTPATEGVPRTESIHTISHFVEETLKIFRERVKLKTILRDTTGVAANPENGSQRISNPPATRSYRAVESPLPTHVTLPDSD